MKRTRYNRQLFALAAPPPARLKLRGRFYELVRVFKHDYFAATCLYQAISAAPIEPTGPPVFPEAVVKFCRRQTFLGLPSAWMGRWLSDHEEAIYRALAGVRGVPRWIARIDEISYAIEYIDGRPLDHPPPPPPGFFDRLRKLFDDVHARGVAYCDANKRSNILIGVDGEPYLVDYQLSVRRRDDLIWPWGFLVRAMVRNVAQKDLYHLYKHKRRMCPQQLTPEEETISRGRHGLHLLHSRLTKPWRAIRRKFLHTLHKDGKLVSPTAELEDHFQPEKKTWRNEDK